MRKAVGFAVFWMLGFARPMLASEALVEGIQPEDTKGPPLVRAFVSSTDRVLPHLASGGDGRNGVFMIFQVFNLTDSPVSEVTIRFVDQQAQSITLPLAPTGEPVSGLRVSNLPPGGVAFARTMPSGSAKTGWALVDAPADPSGLGLSVGLTAIFNQVVPGRPIFQAAIPISTALHNRFFVPYFNTGGFTGTAAVLNLTPQRVTLIARGTDGTELCRSSRLMGQGEQTAFVIAQQLTCAANRDGVLEVRGDSQSGFGLSGIGFLVQDDGAFVTQTVYGMLPQR
jgi:hypothetical protein